MDFTLGLGGSTTVTVICFARLFKSRVSVSWLGTRKSASDFLAVGCASWLSLSLSLVWPCVAFCILLRAQSAFRMRVCLFFSVFATSIFDLKRFHLARRVEREMSVLVVSEKEREGERVKKEKRRKRRRWRRERSESESERENNWFLLLELETSVVILVRRKKERAFAVSDWWDSCFSHWGSSSGRKKRNSS